MLRLGGLDAEWQNDLTRTSLLLEFHQISIVKAADIVHS